MPASRRRARCGRPGGFPLMPLGARVELLDGAQPSATLGEVPMVARIYAGAVLGFLLRQGTRRAPVYSLPELISPLRLSACDDRDRRVAVSRPANKRRRRRAWRDARGCLPFCGPALVASTRTPLAMLLSVAAEANTGRPGIRSSGCRTYGMMCSLLARAGRHAGQSQ
jgi:hypothetical protein